MPRGLWGERHPWTRLTVEQVRAIRASTEPTYLLARRYGVGWSTIANIRLGKSWRHLDDTPAQEGLEPFVSPDLPEGVLALRLFDGSLARIDAADAPLVRGRYWFLSRGEFGPPQVIGSRKGDPTTDEPIALHRLLLDAPLHMGVIYRDGDPLNCQRANLLLIPPNVVHHRTRLYKRNTSGYKGVSLHKRRLALGKPPWRATLVVEKRQLHLGYFATAEEAAQRYNAAARDHYGDLAYQNPINLTDATPGISDLELD